MSFRFRWAGLIAMCTTSCAVVLICIGALQDYSACISQRKLPEFDLTIYFNGLGTILFAFSGHMVFPTIQHDMKKPKEFTKALIQAYLGRCWIGT